jgi:hypothetical protein
MKENDMRQSWIGRLSSVGVTTLGCALVASFAGVIPAQAAKQRCGGTFTLTQLWDRFTRTSKVQI